MQLVSNNSRARDLLGWEPRIGLREGLERTIAWIEKHRDIYKTGQYTV